MTPVRESLTAPWRVIRALATLAAGAVLALVIAHWGWRIFGPAATPVPPVLAVPQAPAAAVTSVPWFGSAAAPANPSGAGALATLPGDTRLLGVIAGRDGAGYALFRFADRGAVLVATGGEIVPGVTLQGVSTEGARISDRGELRTLALRPERALPAGPAGTRPTPPAAASAKVAAASSACTPPGGGGAPPYRLNAELLGGIAAKPDTWSDAFIAGADGLSMREGNAFGTMLGMRPGDKVVQANGVPLRGAGDVLVAVIRPLLANQAVRVTGLREGRSIEWIFVNAGACPV